MIKPFTFVIGMALLSGCAQNFSSFAQNPFANQAGQSAATVADPQAPLGADPLADDGQTGDDDVAALAAQALAALDDGADGATTTQAPTPSGPAISDENSFDAVASRETIQSDAARIERNAQNYQVIEATPLPKPIGDTGPNVVVYALNTSHPVGQTMYPRVKLASEFRYKRACAQLGSPDQAQRSFLSRGGPKVDWYGVDPDGDGYACDWDPTPFRKAAGQ